MTKAAHSILPVIVCDTREQMELWRHFTRFQHVHAGLPVGDFSVLGFHDWNNPGFIAERKSLPDLANSLGNDRTRFLKEIQRLRQFRFRALLIEGTRDDVVAHRYRRPMFAGGEEVGSKIPPESVLGTLNMLAVRCALHIFWCGDHAGVAACLEDLVYHFARGIERDYLTLCRSNGEAKPPGKLRKAAKNLNCDSVNEGATQ